MLRDSFQRIWITVVSLALLIPAAHVPAAHAQSPYAFVNEELDSGPAAIWVALALDSEGNPHIAYWDISNLWLAYAVKRGGAWSYEVIEANATVGNEISIAVDANGVPHVSYNNFVPTETLRYANRAGGSWTFETVDASAGAKGRYSSLAIDAEGRPHISYYDSGDLKYAVKDGAIWTVETAVGTADDEGLLGALDLDASGNPHIVHFNDTTSDLEYARKSGGTWTNTILVTDAVVGYTAIDVDPMNRAHVAYPDDVAPAKFYYGKVATGLYAFETEPVFAVVGFVPVTLLLQDDGTPQLAYGLGSGGLLHVARADTGWVITEVDGQGNVGSYSSMALDQHGLPHIAYIDDDNFRVKYAHAAVRLQSPQGGESWPVGATRSVSWQGAGPVDIGLSTDGGGTFRTIAQGIEGSTPNGGQHDIVVPHSPSRFSKIRIERATPYSASISDSFFTISSEITLLALRSIPLEGSPSGRRVTWATEPGPEDLAGYRLEKADAGGYWRTELALSTRTSHVDPTGGSQTSYRLFAVNKFGTEFELGETTQQPYRALSASPAPYRGGTLSISFATAGGPGGGPGEAKVGLFDARGRLVRRVAGGRYPAGVQNTTWDGSDETGRPVSAGVYFLRATTGGYSESLKVMVIR